MPGRAAAALRADELVLIVNRNEPAGAELAQFYARTRHVPDGRILTLDLPTGDEIPAKQYAREVVPAVRAFLHDHGLDRQVRCLVTFYGVPLRIAARSNTPAEAAELNATRAALTDMPQRMRPGLEAVEAVAQRMDPTFKPPTTGLTLDDIDRRWAAASQTVSSQLPTIPDPNHRSELGRQFFLAAVPLLGQFATLRAEQLDLTLHPDRQAVDTPKLQAGVAAYGRAMSEADADEATPEDALARAKLRRVAEESFGLLRYTRVLHDEVDDLDERHGTQAFDSELSLVHWRAHPHNYVGGAPYASGTAGGRPQWFPNPLSYQFAGVPHAMQPATVMVTRLDAPSAELVKAMIATGVRVEVKGLRGKIVIDSLGAKPGQDPEGHKGYGTYDATLRRLDEMLAGRPDLDVLFDDKPELLPPHSASDVALYVGWYAVGGYVPSCSFAGGAVAMHVASYTLLTLRDPAHVNWATGLLNDGVVATIGPVAEPYLFSFPHADDFFPLLMTGRLTLAECYWRTEPLASWQMDCVGDPLYTPYRADPVMDVADLPPRLRGLFTVPPTTAAAAVK